jgi:Family of unknown function (DUF6506)
MSTFDWTFIFATEGCSASKHRMTMDTPQGKMTVVGVSTHEEGCQVAKAAVEEEKVDFIDLCGDFGPEGCQRVLEAVDHRVPVGYVTYFPEEMEKLQRVLK